MPDILAIFSYCCWPVLGLLFFETFTKCPFHLTNVPVRRVIIPGQFIYDATLFVGGGVFGVHQDVTDLVEWFVVHIDFAFFEDPCKLF